MRSVRLLLLAAVICAAFPMTARHVGAAPGVVSYPRGDEGNSGEMPGPGPGADVAEVWRKQLNGYATSPLVGDGRLYVGSGGGEVLALDLATGEVVWQVTFAGRSADLIGLTDQTLYVAAGTLMGTDRPIYAALSVANGHEIWRFSPSGNVNFARGIVVDGILYAIADDDASDNRVDRVLLAFDPAGQVGHKVLWNYRPVGPVVTIAVEGDGLIISAGDRLIAVDRKTGTEVWVSRVAKSVGAVAARDGLVVFVDYDRNLYYGVEADTGLERWGAFSPGTYTAPAAIGADAIYVKGGNTLYALDLATGSDLWAFTADRDFGPPVIADGVVYAGSARDGGGQVFAVDAETGGGIWNLDPQTSLSTALPVVVDGYLIVGNGSGLLIVLGEP